MIFQRSILLPITLTSLFLASLANADQQPQLGQATAFENKDVVLLPASAMLAINKNGKFAIISDTGRFIIQGKVYDVWQQKELTSIEDARFAANYIPVDKTKLGFSDLSPLSIGTGDKAVTMFSDPACSFCKEIMDEARQSLPQGYRLDVIMLPVLGPESVTRLREITCAKDQAKAWQVAVTGDMKTPLAQKDAADCSMDVVVKRRISAQFLGVRNVPFLIRDDGLTRQGKPAEGLTAWIEQNRIN
ncbi:DsbC family protein [Aquipseudomonas alcaligenes]|uniref:Thiol:disulfide interchange protein n=1 Tax=Aquipseudomonas alcaligenes TaxID=43263 RepID=A0A1N6XEF4_AQUAC|nr:DsbC family protein [Pseudomonas alcaligenes]SIR00728.1 thiol:disulfide interchange protein DsbC [Pseudomonas alcaligenes]